jgi:hypothetical protein
MAALVTLREEADSARLKQIVGFAVGGAAIATGVILYVTGKQASERVAVTPAKGGAIVSLSFTFSR